MSGGVVQQVLPAHTFTVTGSFVPSFPISTSNLFMTMFSLFGNRGLIVTRGIEVDFWVIPVLRVVLLVVLLVVVLAVGLVGVLQVRELLLSKIQVFFFSLSAGRKM